MIEIPYSISREVKIKVNQVLEEISDFFISLCEGSGDFDVHLHYIFPSFLVRKEFDRCKDIVYDIRDYTVDKFPHVLKPLYQYALFHLIQWYIDVTEEDEFIGVDISDLRPLSEDDEFIIKNINNLESYKEFLFDDHDFLDVDNFITIYFANPDILKKFNIELNDYIDLMPYDIRERYLCTNRRNKQNTEVELEELIVRLIYTAIKQQEKDPRRLRQTKETELSDYIANILQVGLSSRDVVIAGEQPSGFALKGIGELDFFIYTQSNSTFSPIAIGENKEWNNFTKHFKQLLGYMNEDIDFGFTIIFNKKTNLKTVLENRETFLREFFVEINGKKYFETIELTKGFKELKDIVISTHKNPENGTLFKVYHFIANAYRPEREEAAKQARSNK